MTVFCSTQDIALALNQEEGYTGNNAIILSSIAQASALIRRYTRREWDFGTFTDYLDTNDIDISINRGKGVYVATLREKPLIDGSVLLRYSPSGRWDDTADVDTTYYTTDARKNQVILYPAVMVSRPRALRVTYQAGYKDEVTAGNANGDANILVAPEHIKQACIVQATWYVRKWQNEINGSDRKGSQSRASDAGMTASGLITQALALLKGESRVLVGGNT
jgi:hypothetical protein